MDSFDGDSFDEKSPSTPIDANNATQEIIPLTVAPYNNNVPDGVGQNSEHTQRKNDYILICLLQI